MAYVLLYIHIVINLVTISGVKAVALFAFRGKLTAKSKENLLVVKKIKKESKTKKAMR